MANKDESDKAKQETDAAFEEFLLTAPKEIREHLRRIKANADSYNERLEAEFPDDNDKRMVEVTCTFLLMNKALRMSGGNMAQVLEDRFARALVVMLSIYTKEDHARASKIWEFAKEMTGVVLVEVERKEEETQKEIKEAVAEVVESFFENIKKEMQAHEAEEEADKHESRGRRGKPDPKKLH